MNLFRIRLPKSETIIEGRSDTLTTLSQHPGREGFFFSEFEENPKLMFIPADDNEISKGDFEKWIAENDRLAAECMPLPHSSTLREDHILHIALIQKQMKDWQHQGVEHTKIIAARIMIDDLRKSPATLFDELCARYPAAFVFLFSTATHGTWIGASPETLLSWHDDTLHTLSMAGTRWADEESADWDEKNREEQGIVTDFITRTLRNAGLTSELYGPYTLNAGPVEHLATDIRASADKDTGFGLISRLSPTPALSGFPRSESIEFINRYENITLFQREMESNMPEGRDCKEKNSNVGDSKKCTRQCYGGVIGYTLPTDDFYSFANLRSGRLYTPGNKIILYAGGGITLRSNPEKEWEETEHKLSTLRNLIK